MPLAVEQQVVGLDVAVNHALLVGVGQGLGRVANHLAHAPDIGRARPQLAGLRREIRIDLGGGRLRVLDPASGWARPDRFGRHIEPHGLRAADRRPGRSRTTESRLESAVAVVPSRSSTLRSEAPSISSIAR